MNDFASADRDLDALFPTHGLNDIAALAALAREIAMDINDLDAILERFRLTAEQYAKIKASRTFQRVLDGAVQAWTSAANAPERIRIEAASTFEQLMPKIADRLESPREALDDVVRGARMLADVAGLIANPAGPGAERVTINIDLGADNKLTLTHAVAAIEPTPSDVAVIEAAAAALPTRR